MWSQEDCSGLMFELQVLLARKSLRISLKEDGWIKERGDYPGLPRTSTLSTGGRGQRLWGSVCVSLDFSGPL